MPLEEAARRRDFTINAIAWDPLTGEYLDPFDGRADLERAPAARRRSADLSPTTACGCCAAMQFAARFELAIDEATRDVCRRHRARRSAGRARLGRDREAAAAAPRPSIGLALGARSRRRSTGCFPKLQALVGCPQEPEWHPEGDVWVHTLMVIDQARTRIDDLAQPQQVAVMLGARLPRSRQAGDDGVHRRTHPIRSITNRPASRRRRALLDRLNVHTIDGFDVRAAGARHRRASSEAAAFFKSPTPVGDGAFRRLAQKVDLELLARVAKSDCLGRTGGFDCSAMDWFLERARALGVEHAPPEPIVKGRHLLELGMHAGPRVGEVLRQIYEQQLDGKVQTLDDGLSLAREIIGAAAPGRSE